MSDLLHETRGNVAIVTLNRPEARNALTFEMYEALGRICRETTLEDPVKAIIITGAGGKAFAAGTDMTQFRAFSTPDDAIGYEERMDRVLGDIERCPVPTIAAITGACTGGGAAIAAACDIRICDRNLKFGFPIARTLGNCLSIGNLNRMSALVGMGRVRDMILMATLLGSDDAKACGLIYEVMDRPEDVQTRAMEIAGTMAEHAPLTMRATKETLRRLRTDGPGADCSDLIIECYMSADFKEGMEAFLGKRKPAWTGK